MALFPRFMLAVATLITVVAAGTAATTSAAPVKDVRVAATIAGPELRVSVRATAKAACVVEIGEGADAVRLPPAVTGSKGRARVMYPTGDLASGRQPVSATCTAAGHRATGSTSVVVPAADSDENSPMSTVLNVLLDVLLGGSLLLFLWLLIDMVIRADPRERLMRSLALVGGAVIALGAQAAGVGISEYTIDALTGARPVGEAFKVASIIVPGGIAALFGWYFVRATQRSADMALRLMSFLGMLTVVTFAVIFAQATNTQGVFLGEAAIPNASFVVGLIAAIVIFLPTSDAPEKRRGEGLTALGRWTRSRFSKGTEKFVAKEQDTAPSAVAPRRNPFDD